MPRALVTGASGFAGPYLVRHLLEQGHEVVGCTHGPGTTLREGHREVRLDVTDKEEVGRVVAEVGPDEVYHLAGLTRPTGSTAERLYEVNLGGALNLLEAVSEHVPEAGTLLVGSAYAYGRSDRPIAESDPLEPLNHYGVSKAAADLLGYTYAARGLRVVRARPFNHSGPGQNPDFVLPTLVQQFAEIIAGERKPVVYLGNLESVRDLSDVRDIVRAYHLAVKRGNSGDVYNVGSGRGVSVRDLFELVRREASLEVELGVEPSRVRATDIPYLVADVSRAERALGWRVEIPLQRTIRDMLDAAGSVRSLRGSV